MCCRSKWRPCLSIYSAKETLTIQLIYCELSSERQKEELPREHLNTVVCLFVCLFRGPAKKTILNLLDNTYLLQKISCPHNVVKHSPMSSEIDFFCKHGWIVEILEKERGKRWVDRRIYLSGRFIVQPDQKPLCCAMV